MHSHMELWWFLLGCVHLLLIKLSAQCLISSLISVLISTAIYTVFWAELIYKLLIYYKFLQISLMFRLRGNVSYGIRCLRPAFILTKIFISAKISATLSNLNTNFLRGGCLLTSLNWCDLVLTPNRATGHRTDTYGIIHFITLLFFLIKILWI